MDQIHRSEEAVRFAQEAANAEEKSSAGDKYETGRAMAQIARDQAAQQLAEALKLKSVLDRIDPLNKSAKVVLGSLVVTESLRFYLSVSLGKLILDQQDYYAVSQQSPIGKLLSNAKVNDVIEFNNQTLKIINIL
jgi:transcription elongation GreA/GreB family factor